MRKVTWSDFAEFDYDENIDFLLKRWGFNEAGEFVTKVEEIIFNHELIEIDSYLRK